MQIVDVIPERFGSFLFVSIDIEYKNNALFTHILLQIYIDNDISIIINLDNVLANKPVLLQDNMKIN